MNAGYEHSGGGVVVESASMGLTATDGFALEPEAGELRESWQRCLHQHHLCPGAHTEPIVLSQFELQRLRMPLERTLATVREELDHLYGLMQPSGYAVLLADTGGVIIERRCRAADADEFAAYGTRVGALWSEAVAGTNGIGTCIYEQRALNVHRGQHFRKRYESLSCSGAPIFDAEGRLQVVLALASCATETSDRAHALALTVAANWARSIEEREFRERNRAHWTLALKPCRDDGPTMLLAIDAGGRIVGADRLARRELASVCSRLARGVCFEEIFAGLPARLKSCGEDIPLRLMRNGGIEWWRGLATPPVSTRLQLGPSSAGLLTRPRLSALAGTPEFAAQPISRGGLAPCARRAVCDYIESNLDKTISVDELAAIAGLSLKHFSRAFQRSVGLSPHRYIVQQRAYRAAQLLVDTDLAMCQIAQAAGFSDQSHLTRSFSRLTGSTPRDYRRALHRPSSPKIKPHASTNESTFVQSGAGRIGKD